MAEQNTTVMGMPTRAEVLIERRRLEAERRREERRLRRRALTELVLVAALTIPVIVTFSDRGPDAGSDGSDHLEALVLEERNIPPSTTPTSATPVVETGAPMSAGREGRPAPRAVRRVAREHGGSHISPWVALECAEVAELVRRNGLPDWMTTVAWRESRCRHRVTNFDRSTADQSYGLFQINVLGDLWTESQERCGLRKPEQLLDPDVNVACAAALYRAYGYRPWDSGTYFNQRP